MLSTTQLKQIIHSGKISRTDQLLLCLALDADSAKQVKVIKAIAVTAGLPAAKTWNVSKYLGSSKGMAIRIPRGWELTAAGRTYVAGLVGVVPPSPAASAGDNLRTHLGAITNPDIRRFVDETIACLDHKLLRAAVVLSWVGAVFVLYSHVVRTCLPTFNAEASRRDSKWRPAKTTDDLARMKESEFLDCLEAISVLGRNVKLELAKSLQLRNGCGHPNSLVIGEHAVAAHIELLILNIFSHFPL